MHIAHSRSLDLSRPHPTLLFAYGGFAWTQGAVALSLAYCVTIADRVAS
jgi:hypothetical protein